MSGTLSSSACALELAFPLSGMQSKSGAQPSHHAARDFQTRPELGGNIRTGSREWSIAICDGIIDLLAVLFDVDSKQLRSSSRTTKPVARVRQIGMYVAHVVFGMRMSEVGVGFGRDKSTILYACHLIEDMRDDEEFDLVVSRVEAILSAAFSSVCASVTAADRS